MGYIDGPGHLILSLSKVLYFQTGADVCQLRLDFETFTLTNPATRVATPAATAGGTYTSISYGGCETDFFTVSTPGATGKYKIWK